MEKNIKVGEKEMKAKATALVPRLYRHNFNRDIIQDIKQLERAFKKAQADGSEFPIADLEIFENVAWLFFKQGGEDVGTSPDEWLDNLDGVFSIYQVLPQILELWGLNLKTTATPKKK